VRSLVEEFAVALRILSRNRTFTFLALTLLALGIGTSTALFNIVDATLIHPLPFKGSARLVNLRSYWKGVARAPLSYPDFVDLSGQNSVLEKAAIYRTDNFALKYGSTSIHVHAGIVSSRLFSMLGAKPLVGRDFFDDEDRQAGVHATFPLILSHALWIKGFSANPGVIGSSVSLDGTLYTIVGVMPPEFSFPLPPAEVDLWTTTAVDLARPNSAALASQRSAHYFQGIGLLKLGVGLATARTEIDAIGGRLAQTYPETNRGETIEVTPEADIVLGDRRPQLRMLAIGIICLILISYINVVTLLLSRAAGHVKDFAVRLALGASRFQIVRGILTQCIWLSIFGAVMGLVFAKILIGFFRSQIVGADLVIPQFNWSPDVIVFIAAIVVISPLLCSVGLGFSLLIRKQLPSLLGARNDGGALRGRLGDGLVIGQMSLAVVLLCVAGLLSRSLVAITHVDLGLRSERIATLELQFPTALYKNQQRPVTLQSLLFKVRQLPGVESASAVSPLPLNGNVISADFDVLGKTSAKQLPSADMFSVSEDYFSTMGLKVIHGRPIGQQDLLPSSPQVAIINESLARRFFGDQSPLGRRIRPQLSFGEDAPPYREIIGVVRDVKANGARTEAGPQVYMPYNQLPAQAATIVIRSVNDSESVIDGARKALLQVDPNLVFYNVRWMREYVAISQASTSMIASVLLFFAFIGLFLASVGLYGVISYRVALRMKVFSIYMALGAPRKKIMSAVLKHALALSAMSMTIGLIFALLVSRLMSGVLFGVSPYDVPTLLAVIGVLSVVSLAASYLPALRAAGADPAAVLRME
jgi:putative ABC transport system permease protein